MDVAGKKRRDWRKSRLFAPIVAMTLGGLALLVIISIFLVRGFDLSAAEREQKMVAHGFARQLDEIDAVIVPQVDWDEAVKRLDHAFDPHWADFNLGNYLFTFNGVSRAFVLDQQDRPIYAAINGERANVTAFAPYSEVAAQLVPSIRRREAARPPFQKAAHGKVIISRPIQVNGLAQIAGRTYIVVATLVQPDLGKVLPTGPRAPIAITAVPVDQALLDTFAARYLLQDLKLVSRLRPATGSAQVPLRALDGTAIGTLAWTPRQPGTRLLEQLRAPLLFALALFCFIAWLVVRQGARIVSDLIASETRAKHLAYHDPLTGLPNRTMLFERLRLEMVRLTRGGLPLAVMCVDLDRFKEVNDTLGHHAGDLVIEEVGRRLRAVCNEMGLIARLGGDEFVVLGECATPASAGDLAGRIKAAICEPIGGEYGRLEVGCSIGIAILDQAIRDPSEVLRWADLALYRAKELGRQRVTFFEPEMDLALRNRRSLEAELRQALLDDGLSMVYQPQVDRSGAIKAVEALVRWHHPERGNIPPGIFVPLAEEGGLILALGEFVLRRVFEETAGWSNTRVAINVSAVQMRAPGFAALVTRLIAQAGINPSHYEIELTETALLGDDPVTASNVDALKRLGLSIALDDFGTGYSSLSVLQRFAVDKIKIDRSFVSGLGAGDESEALVDAMVKLARALNLDVIAEGVETEQQRDRLLSCGCREFQGHLIGMPMDIASLADLLGEGREQSARKVSRRR